MSSTGSQEDRLAARPLLPPYDLAVDTWLRRALRYGGLLALVVALIVYGFYYALTTPWLMVPFTLPIVVLALLVIWALPEMRTAPTRTTQRLFFAFFVCLIGWPNYLAISLPGLPWITLIRLTGFPLTLMLLVSLSISSKFRSELREILQETPLIWRGVAIFAVIMVLTLPMSDQPMTSFQKVLAFQINWIVVFFASVVVFARRGRIEMWIYLLLAFVILISMLAILEHRQQKILWAGHIPSFLAVEDPVVQRILAGSFRSATDQYRVKTIFTTPLGLAEFMALSVPVLLHLTFGPFNRYVRIIAFATYPLAFFVIVLTGSRLGMVGALLGTLLYILVWSLLRWRRFKMGLVAPALLVAYPAIASAVAAASFFVPRIRRMVWGGGATAASDASRETQLILGIPKIFQNPFGYGTGRGASVIGFRGANDTLTIDNYFLLIVLEYGVIGFIIYYGLFVAAIVYALRALFRAPPDRELSLLAPLAVTLTCFIVIKWVFSQQDNHPLIFMMLGMITALVWRLNKRHPAPKRPPP